MCLAQMEDRVEDLLQAGVLDPAKVTRSGLMNACGIAGIMLTTQVHSRLCHLGNSFTHHLHAYHPCAIHPEQSWMPAASPAPCSPRCCAARSSSLAKLRIASVVLSPSLHQRQC